MGIDCVKFIIDQNINKWPQYKFIQDNIRDCDLYIIKDVLQHWKLYEIYTFLDKLILKKFKYIIITNNGNQSYDNLELTEYLGNGRGLNSNYLPLKKYNAIPLLNYFGDENKHICMILNNLDIFDN